MMTFASRRMWIALVTIDALFVLGISSAMAAPVTGAVASPAHLPTVLLAGIGLIGVKLSYRHTA